MTVEGSKLIVCVGAGPWAKTVLVRNWKAGAFGSGAAAALPAVLFEAPACGAAAAGAASGAVLFDAPAPSGAAAAGAASPAVLFDAPAAAAGGFVALAAAVTVSLIVLVTVCAAALPFPFPFPFPPSSAPKSANSPPAPFPFPPLASMPSLLTRRISWEKPLALTSDR